MLLLRRNISGDNLEMFNLHCRISNSGQKCFNSGNQLNISYVMTVGASRPVILTRSDVASAAFTRGATASAVFRLSASWPASTGTYFSMYMRIVAPEEPVPAITSGITVMRINFGDIHIHGKLPDHILGGI